MMNQTSPHIFVGYLDNVNEYVCFNPANGKMMISRDVIFLENDFSKNCKIKTNPDLLAQECS